jgi:anti-sigma regulatory factor (Ser/Thr protein kinase)
MAAEPTLVETQLTLPPEAGSVPSARHHARQVLKRWSLAERHRQVVELLVSELVTNAVVHARCPLALSVRYDGRSVRVDVSDSSPSWPIARRVPPNAPSGRGLQIVERLSDRHGVRPTGRGKAVWFEISV